VSAYPTNRPAPPGYNPHEYHTRALERGVNKPFYWAARAILQPFFHVYFRMRRSGMEHVPKSGPVIFAANHRSFVDPFVIGTLTRRPVYYLAKKELFLHPVAGWLMSRLGGFPIDRGGGDVQAMETARRILERGDCVVIFPEGTRTRPGPLGSPHRGVGGARRTRCRVGDGGCSAWLARAPASRTAPLRASAQLSARGQSLAGARRCRHRTDMGLRCAAMGLAWRGDAAVPGVCECG
jgi:1-acyl-sn-glycerol-3-phosphate acyltransferase